MLKMIIVDDERIMRETISSMIDWKNYEVEIIGLCKNGMEAYDMIIDECPDIVLTDIRMPGMNGLELIKKISQTDLDTLFLLLSGYGEFEYAKEAMKYGVKNYILKPCSENQIIDAIKQCKEDYELRLSSKRIKENTFDIVIAKMQRLFQTARSENHFHMEEFIALFYDISDIYLLKQLTSSLFLKLTAWIPMLSTYELTEWLIEFEKENSIETCKSLINQKLITVLSATVGQPQSKSVILQIYQYIDDHIGDSNITLKYICEHDLFLNVDYVSRKFFKETGEKFSAYLTRKRIDTAKKIFNSQPSATIQSVAELVGCGNNPQYFSMLFKKQTGITPSTYIAHVREEK